MYNLKRINRLIFQTKSKSYKEKAIKILRYREAFNNEDKNDI
jgi:hypothetical protein